MERRKNQYMSVIYDSIDSCLEKNFDNEVFIKLQKCRECIQKLSQMSDSLSEDIYQQVDGVINLSNSESNKQILEITEQIIIDQFIKLAEEAGFYTDLDITNMTKLQMIQIMASSGIDLDFEINSYA